MPKKRRHVQLAFVEKEAITMWQKAEKEWEKAELEANLHILHYQSRAAVAAAEAATYLEADSSVSKITHEETKVPEKPLSSAECASEYAQKLISMHASQQSLKLCKHNPAQSQQMSQVSLVSPAMRAVLDQQKNNL